MIGADPYAVLETVDPDAWPEDFDPYEAALRQFGPDNLASLSRILMSDNDVVTRRGLHLFGELGRKAFPVLDEALCHVGHPDPMARCGLMNGFLCYSKRLASDQIQKVLSIEDLEYGRNRTSCLVRYQVIGLMSAVRQGTVRNAILQFADERRRSRHLDAFKQAPADFGDAQKAFDHACDLDGLEQSYALAALQAAARLDLIKVAPRYDGDDFVCASVISQIERVIYWHFRRNDPVGWRKWCIEHRKRLEVSER